MPPTRTSVCALLRSLPRRGARGRRSRFGNTFAVREAQGCASGSALPSVAAGAGCARAAFLAAKKKTLDGTGLGRRKPHQGIFLRNAKHVSAQLAIATPRRIKASHRRRWKITAGHFVYQHTDSLGSPVAVTDQSKAVTERTQYTPFGAPLNHPVEGIGYTGHVMDQATGLVYAQQRYFDPQLGRFLSMDPVPTDPNTGANFSRYAYALDNPYRFVDPDGRYACSGSKDQCAAVAAALKRVETASKNKSNSARTNSVLRSVLKFYGKAGVANGVRVETNTAKPGRDATAATYGNNSTIKLNQAGIQKSTAGLSASERTEYVGSVLVHEGSHGNDQRNAGGLMTYERDEIKAGETKAYTAEGHYSQATSTDFGGLLTPSGSIDFRQVDKSAEASTNLACSEGWGCL